ncbi:MAG: biotin/lipoyl-binding protein, partial [Gammaproteobacteria bacterium]|nr:biotin/lipoyl-binding protein [Gammaproteobacteria bacterium]
MSTVFESFDLNDPRKSTRILLPGRATLRGIELNIADWSFEGFRVTDARSLGRAEINTVVDITFALHDAAFHFDFKHPARVVWSTETQTGFEWLLVLPVQVRTLLRQYLVSQHSVIPREPVTHIPSLSLKIVPPSIEPAQTDPPQPLNNQRKSRLAGYAIASLLLLLAITFLGYENQFVVSTRALYLGNLAEVVAATDGMIDKILVKRGEFVNAGDAVATLDGHDLDIQKSAMERLVKERVAAVKVAQSAVTETSTPLSMYAEVANQQLAVAHAKVAEARATMNLRKGYYERLLELDHNGQIGKSELERASAEAESAASHHQASVEEAMLAEKVATEAKAGRFFNGNKVDNDLQLFRVGLT